VPVGRSLGTCATSGSDPTLWPVQCDSVLSCHFDFGVTTTINFRIVMRGGLTCVSGVSRQFLPRSVVAIAVVAL
jgi:hypothetical protein